VKGLKIIITAVLLNVIIMGLIPTTGSEEAQEIQVDVMIDLGNGVVNWAQVELDSNKTAIFATESACENLDLDITVIWSQWGAFVYDIDGKSPPLDYSWWWGFFVWNDTLDSWDDSQVGASFVEMEDGDAIAWYPVWDYLEPARPIATPSDKYPWPSFQRDGVNSGATEISGPASNAIQWIFNTRERELAASPVIADDKVVVTNYGGTFCLDGEGLTLWRNSEVIGVFSPTIGHDSVLVGGKDGYLYSLNNTNGEIIWKTQITENPGLSGVTSPPKIERGRIFLGSYDVTGGTGYLYCIKESSGTVLWKNTTLSSVYFSSPCVEGDKVYVGTMGLYDSSTLKWDSPYAMYCFDTKEGDLIWEYAVEGSVGSSPTITDGKLLFTSKDGFLYCLDSQDGGLIWKKEIGDSVSSPAVFEDTIFVGSGEMNGEGLFYSLDLESNILWEFEPNGAVQSSPAVAGDYVYFASNVKNGTVYCLKRETGQLVWQYRPWPEEYIISSPAVVDERMYIASDNGRLYCFGGESPSVTVDKEGTTKIIQVGEEAKVAHGDEELCFIIRSMDEGKMSVEIDTLAKSFELQVGQSKKVDTDGDGEKDLLITANSLELESQSAQVTFEEYSEDEDLLIYYVLMIVIIVAAIALIVIFRKGRKNTEIK
jgi:outer membrane protein assembly factor BamB